MITLYDSIISGNSHRVKLALSLFSLPHKIIPIDILQGEQRRPKFLAINPFGTCPTLDDDGFIVRDSVAILMYLARRYDKEEWYPREVEAETRINEWLMTAADGIGKGLATARYIRLFAHHLEPNYELSAARGVKALGVMDAHLKDRAWLAADHPTIADIAGYSYVKRAPEGDIALDPYPNVLAWLARIEGLPNFVPFPAQEIKRKGGDH